MSKNTDPNIIVDSIDEQTIDPAKQELIDLQKELIAKVQAEAEAILETAKKTAKDIIKTANKEAGKSEEKTSIPIKPEPEKEEFVTIKLFKDSGRYKNDAVFALNGKAYKIQRGKEVRVPLGVAELIKFAEKQDMSAALMREKLEVDYAASLR